MRDSAADLRFCHSRPYVELCRYVLDWCEPCSGNRSSATFKRSSYGNSMSISVTRERSKYWPLWVIEPTSGSEIRTLIFSLSV